MTPTDAERKDFYNSRAWRTLRARTVNSFIKHQRNCIWCNKPLVRGDKHIVDHVNPIRTHWHLRLEPDNLSVLCHACHTKKTHYVDYNTKEEVNDEGYPPGWQ